MRIVKLVNEENRRSHVQSRTIIGVLCYAGISTSWIFSKSSRLNALVRFTDITPLPGLFPTVRSSHYLGRAAWKSLATLTLLAKQDCPFGYNMIAPFGQNSIDHLAHLLL